MKPGFFALLVLFVSFSLVGCGGKPKPELLIVEAEVQIDGKPASDIQVTVMPDISEKNNAPASLGTSESGGKVSFKTMKGGHDGVAPGPARVTAIDMLEDRPRQGEKQEHPSRIAGRYATEAGGLKVQVKSGEKLILNFKSK